MFASTSVFPWISLLSITSSTSSLLFILATSSPFSSLLCKKSLRCRCFNSRLRLFYNRCLFNRLFYRCSRLFNRCSRLFNRCSRLCSNWWLSRLFSFFNCLLWSFFFGCGLFNFLLNLWLRHFWRNTSGLINFFISVMD